MRTLFIIALFFAFHAAAQNIVFQNATFKQAILNNQITYDANGAHINADINHDGEISISEANAIIQIQFWDMNKNSNLNDVNNFKNLIKLNVGCDNLSSINLTDLKKLEFFNVYVYNNILSDIDVSSLINLKQIQFENYNNSSTYGFVNIDQLTNLEKIILTNCITTNTINFSNLTKLEYLQIKNIPSIQTLYIPSQIDSLFITSLTSLINLDFSNLNNLSYIHLNNLPLTSLNFSNLTLLKTIYLYSLPNLTQLTLENLPNIDSLFITSLTSLINLDFSNLNNLSYLYLNDLPLTSLNFSNSTLLKTIYLYSLPNLTQLTLENLPNIDELSLSSQPSLTQLKINNLSNLQYLDLYTLPLVNNLQLTILPLLKNLSLANIPSIQQLDVSNYTNLESFYCANIGLTSIDVSNNTELSSFKCSLTKLTTLDMSHNKKLTDFECSDNANLEILNLKTGIKNKIYNYDPFKNNTYLIDGNPKLKYICVDDDDINNQYLIDSLTLTINKPEVNTYCTFVPGGDYNTINGKLIYDADNNGCDTLDRRMLGYNKMGVLLNSNLIGETFVQKTGDYFFYEGAGTFQIQPLLENPSYFNVLPVLPSITFVDSLNHTQTQDFCIAANGSVTDLEIAINPTTVARPGFNANYQLVYKNKGNQIFNGPINLQFNDTLLTQYTSSVTENSLINGLVTWNVSNLLPFETRTIDLSFNVNSPTNVPAVNINDSLIFTATIDSTNDVLPIDNLFQLNQIVVGAYDPNIITCLEGTIIPKSMKGNYLHYTIDFENTGNYPAENIVVKQEIDSKKHDPSTLQILTASDDVYIRKNGKVVEYIFDNIQLATNNHGNILLKLQIKDSVSYTDTLPSQADIYFDYNAPVQTNNENVTFFAHAIELSKDLSVQAYPNPSTTGKFNIEAQSTIQFIEAYDAQGRIIFKRINNQNNATQIDLSNQENGIYFLKIKTQQGDAFQKVQIEK